MSNNNSGEPVNLLINVKGSDISKDPNAADGDIQLIYQDVARIAFGDHTQEMDVDNLDGIEPFNSLEEQIKAQRSSRYRHDVAYRNLVVKKIEAARRRDAK